MARKIDIGDQLPLTATFTDPATGELVDPTAVTCKVKQPDTATADVDVVRQSVGVYVATFLPTQTGEHWFKFWGTGAWAAAEQAAFVVETPQVT